MDVTILAYYKLGFIFAFPSGEGGPPQVVDEESWLR